MENNMNEKITKIKEVVNEITKGLNNDIVKDDYKSYEQKIRAIEQLLHAIALTEKL